MFVAIASSLSANSLKVSLSSRSICFRMMSIHRSPNRSMKVVTGQLHRKVVFMGKGIWQKEAFYYLQIESKVVSLV